MKYLSFILVFFGSLAHAQSYTSGLSSPGFPRSMFLTGALTPTQLTTPTTATAWGVASPPRYYSMAVTTTATGFQVILEGSLDNSNWSTIAITNSAIGMVSNVVPIPSLYFRMRAATIAAGTTVTGTAIGAW